MKTNIILFLFVFLVSCNSNNQIKNQQNQTEIMSSPTPEIFVKNYVKAYRCRNYDLLLSLHHPLCIEYYNKNQTNFFQAVTKSSLNEFTDTQLQVNYQFDIVDFKNVNKNVLYYPTKPQKVLHVNWDTEFRDKNGMLIKTEGVGRTFSVSKYKGNCLNE